MAAADPVPAFHMDEGRLLGWLAEGGRGLDPDETAEAVSELDGLRQSRTPAPAGPQMRTLTYF